MAYELIAIKPDGTEEVLKDSGTPFYLIDEGFQLIGSYKHWDDRIVVRDEEGNIFMDSDHGGTDA